MQVTTMRSSTTGKHLFQLIKVETGGNKIYYFQHYKTRIGGKLAILNEVPYGSRENALQHWNNTFTRTEAELNEHFL